MSSTASLLEVGFSGSHSSSTQELGRNAESRALRTPPTHPPTLPAQSDSAFSQGPQGIHPHRTVGDSGRGSSRSSATSRCGSELCWPAFRTSHSTLLVYHRSAGIGLDPCVRRGHSLRLSPWSFNDKAVLFLTITFFLSLGDL